MIKMKVFEGEFQKNPTNSMHFMIVFSYPMATIYKYYLNSLQTIY